MGHRWGGWEGLPTGRTPTRNIRGKNTFILYLVSITTLTQRFSKCGSLRTQQQTRTQNKAKAPLSSSICPKLCFSEYKVQPVSGLWHSLCGSRWTFFRKSVKSNRVENNQMFLHSVCVNILWNSGFRHLYVHDTCIHICDYVYTSRCVLMLMNVCMCVCVSMGPQCEDISYCGLWPQNFECSALSS